MQDGLFTELQKPSNWSQPAIAPDGSRLVAVQRTELNYSDVYLLDPGSGQVTSQLTKNKNRFVVESNLWSFYPRFSADGGSIFYSSDRNKDFTYRVDLAIWQMSVAQPQNRPVLWTDPNPFTGGDVSPAPLKDGGLLYVKYNVDDQGQSYSQLWLTRRPRDVGKALTQPGESCAQPSVSPDQSQVAMICSVDKRSASLVVAPFDGQALGARRTLVSGELVSAPTWAPDGSGLIYLASAGSAAVGNFQLWWLALPAPAPTPTADQAGPSPTPTPAPKPRQVTTRLDFDGLSPPVWVK
jgi:Tol biopolymer transport system component